ncbi:MAG: hypothetical protein U1F45_08930 [Burkholderiales bacterium]
MLRENFVELLLNDHRILLAVTGFVLPMLGLGYLVWRLEPRGPYRWSVTVTGVAVALAAYAGNAQSLSAMGMMDLISWNHKVATFVRGIGEYQHHTWRLRGRCPPRPLVQSPSIRAHARQTLPDIIIVLEESTFDIRPFIADRERKARLDEFFSPSHSKSGSCEFIRSVARPGSPNSALLTGIPHLNFGPGGYYAPFLLKGRRFP